MVACRLMRTPLAHSLGCASLLLVLVCPTRAEVTVVRTFPANGERAVNPKADTLRIRFSEPVMRDSFSLMTLPNGAFPEIVKPIRIRYEDGDRVLAVSIRLKPGTRYAVGVNGEQAQNFRAAAPPNEPVTPYVFTFITAPAAKPRVAPKKPGLRRPAPRKAIPKKAATRAERWQSDLDTLAVELPERHINLFDRLPEGEFRRQVRDLRSRVAKMDDIEVVANIARIVASVGDAHTGVDVWQNGEPRVLPVRVRPFRDGWFIIAATEPYKGLLGGRLVSFGDLDMEEACRRISAFVPHDNASGLRNVLPGYMAHAGLLKAAGIEPDDGRVRLTVRRAEGETTEAEVETLTVAELARAKILPWFDSNEESAPVSLRSRKASYHLETLQDGRSLYFAYNRCADDANMPLKAFLSGLEDKMRRPEVERLVIDLRGNSGGNSSLLDPFIGVLKEDKRLNRRGHLYALIGPATFSSAVLNAVRLKTETSAILVGEPTGGRPGHYGEVRFMLLPHSGLTVTYSTKKFSAQGLTGDALEPDIRVETSSRDFATGQDPVLLTCLGSVPAPPMSPAESD